MPPMQEPEEVARALVSLAERPRRELYVPRYARLGVALHRVFPNLVNRALLHLTREWHFGYQSQPITSGTLYSPAENSGQVRGHRPARTTLPGMLLWGARHLVRGIWRKRSRRSSLRPHSSP
jgi:hypothetical protein